MAAWPPQITFFGPSGCTNCRQGCCSFNKMTVNEAQHGLLYRRLNWNSLLELVPFRHFIRHWFGPTCLQYCTISFKKKSLVRKGEHAHPRPIPHSDATCRNVTAIEAPGVEGLEGGGGVNTGQKQTSSSMCFIYQVSCLESFSSIMC